MRTYTDKDMVQVVVDGQVQPDPVPGSWVGTDLLPPGAKKATKSQVEKAEAGEASGGSGDDSGSGGSGPVTSGSGGSGS